MAKYSKKAQSTVEEAMHKFKKGTLKSGKKGERRKGRKPQASSCNWLSEARDKGAKVLKKAGN